MKGIVVKYDDEKKFGFIKTKDNREDVFFHINFLKNAKSLSIFQEVEFEIENTSKGFRAINIIAGKKQTSPFILYGIISFISTMLIMAFLFKKIHPINAYLVGINITTFLIYAYDKLISSSNKLRVPEIILHSLAFLGGSILALVAQKFLHHKTIKRSFQIVYWITVIIQIIILWFIFYRDSI